MPGFVEIDPVSLNDWTLRFHDKLGVAVDRVIKYEMRLTLRDAIAKSNPKSLSSGRASVQANFRRASRPIEPALFSNSKPRTLSRLTTLIRKKDTEAVNAVLHDMPGRWKRWDVVPFSTDLFLKAPRRDGKVKSQRKFVFEKAEWNRELRHNQAHLGRLKAGWLPGYYAAGGKQASSWIHRHFSGARGYIQQEKSGQRQVFIVENHALGVGRTIAMLRKLLASRARTAKKDFYLFLSGVKDISQIQ